MNKINKIITYILLIVISIWTLFPLYYLFLTSIKPRNLLFEANPAFFFTPNLESYKNIFVASTYGKFYINSILVTIPVTILTVLLGSFGSFAFSNFKFKKKEILFFLILFVRMFPPVTTLIPVYLIIGSLKLLDSRLALILVLTSFQIPLVMLILRGFFEGIPSSIMESAELDGCTPWRVFISIVLPLAKPSLFASGILVFVMNWNEFLFPLVLTSVDAVTLPVAVASFLESEGMIQWGAVSALASTAIIPIIVFGIFMNKFLVKGLMAGSFK
ncbi:carbohydrate ABC transporter permease [Atribacter laminatus]|uniref:Maltose/maltodextrin transport system permease protein MalG n=1 Tax=Atribacter laminatus TaxID=2847778 RepID=A0A7T1F2M5_ATRLM|nr:carbohydrate ABC transporter permease [Atribacter laminatus]QPM67937.1 Trehalose transport system permease protein SugB [Atribacter laminatus]